MDIKINFSSKRTIVGIIALICLIGLILYLPTIISLTNPQVCTVNGVCLHEERLNLLTDLIPVFILAGIIIGAIVFFVMNERIESKQKDIKKIAETLIQFLNKEEKTVLQKILDNNGKVLQSEITHIEGMSKLRSHRIIQRLTDRGVIETEKYGKTNIVKLKKEIMETLMEKK